MLVYVERASWVHYWWVTKRLLSSPRAKPLGWPEGSPMVASTLDGFRGLRLSSRFWNAELKATLMALRPAKRVYTIRDESDESSLLNELQGLVGNWGS